ncbi:MAG: hypothetical protein IJA03_01125, partial [Bacteroidaceae bacterium]|nr:hypothetical protein [Bacteroidaceae bacterium]
VRTIFELPKLFRRNFQKKVFLVEVQDPNFVSAFQLICVSLSKAGAKLLLYNISSKHSKHFFAENLHPFT